MSNHKEIEIIGARVHNLKNIDVSIPRDQLVVITGLSGSGKSSLAFDTIYAEGQRRYIETFSAYARQFLGGMERPDVDKISGLSPVISIEQKTISKNPRSTVGTITEIYDFLRLLFARAADAYSYNTGEKMVRYSEEQIIHLILQEFAGKKILLLAPVVKGRKGHYRELFQQIIRQGFLRARVDGKIIDLTENLKLDRYKVHDIEIVIDRTVADFKDVNRLSASCKTALQHGKGTFIVMDHDTEKIRYFSKHLMCPSTGISYSEPEPSLFSFNSPYGACDKCNGLGEVSEIDLNKVIPDKVLSIKKGGLAPLGPYKNNWIFKQVETLLEKHGCNLDTPVGSIDESLITQLLYGSEEMLTVKSGIGLNDYTVTFEGIVNFLSRQSEENTSASIQRWTQSFMNTIACPQCNGSRLKKESLYFKINNRSIFDFTQLNLEHFAAEFDNIEADLSDKQNQIARDVLKEIRSRTKFLLDVGLGYLTLNRNSRSLSGGEAQRIRLATQIGSKLVGVLYILDEPSIGLHQRDNHKLIDSLKKLRDSGNSVIVVEHDKEMMMSSDYILDIGPKAGIHGGRVVAQGSVSEVMATDSLTGDYLNGRLHINIPVKRREGNGKKLVLRGASGNNLKNVDVEFPLGKMICVTGVSGSGKSTLINGTLYPILNHFIYRGVKKPLPYKKIEGLEHLDKVIEIDQSPIGRTPRSNPATYTGMFNEIRNLFSMLPEAKIRGYKPGRFSFNTKGGRCETCTGAGLKTIEMNFLPDVYVQCETCGGKRYNRETLEVRFKGKSIADVLDMTVENAVVFFSEIPKIQSKLLTLQEVGLSYLTLGQQSTTLSGGEAQRIKLASELSKRETGNTFYILDEPTTGLHFEDVRMLIDVLNKLTDSGNTVLVIEHNMDLIKVADHIIDIGPEGGEKGGEVVFTGTPESMIKSKKGYTGAYLKKELMN
jgi:excinuclease ABC subunit A